MYKYPMDALFRLDFAATTFFPKDGSWNSICFTKSKDMNMKLLPCNLRDDKWISNMLMLKKNLHGIKLKHVLNYVKYSEFFKEKRHEYELKIVSWQINYMKNGGEGWIVSDRYKDGIDFYLFSDSCDLIFRDGVLTTLIAIGMDKEVVEEGLEKNADLWRDYYMECAYDNKFNPIRYCGWGEKEESSPVDLEHKEKWMKLRKYLYYLEHKEAVDKYGIVSDDMKLTQEEVDSIYAYLIEKDTQNENIRNQDNCIKEKLSTNSKKMFLFKKRFRINK